MKKRIITLISIIVLTFCLSAFLVGCGDEETTIEYSVTVLSPEEEPLSGITVSWMAGSSTAGKATTDENGTAKASLPAGTYSIALSGQPDGLSYTAVSVSPSMANIELSLVALRITYTATVQDKTGAPASGVTVTWISDGKIAGTATTNASGMASCELDSGNYTVLLSTLPDGNLFAGAQNVSGDSPSASFSLRDGSAVTYKVTVRSEGGLLFENQSVVIYSGDNPVAAGKTNAEGVYTFSAMASNYTVRGTELPNGYSYEATDLSATLLETELVLKSKIITDAPAADLQYVIGDIFHNYTFTTPYQLNGAVWSKSVSDILREKEVLLLNNWGTNCSWCVTEMPDMQKMYEKYADQIEIVAVSNYNGGDSNTVIGNYYAQNGYSFPMMRDENGFAYKFGLTGWPTTIVIDRYGAIARIETGAITSEEAWERLILKYIGDDYKQTFTPGKPNESINTEVAKPDVEIPADHYEKLAEAIHNQSTFPEGTTVVWRGETEYEYAWPFVFGVRDDVSSSDPVMYASNTGKANSMAIIYADVTVEPGKVFTFDYYADTESADVLYFLWDGKIIREISGNSSGWQTCYLYSEITEGKHTLAVTYMKDSSGNVGKDNVYIKNVRFMDVAAIDQPTDMLRGAAYGKIDPFMGTFAHYADVAIGDDGYYHVNLSEHDQNLWGTDESPLLLVNLLNATPWSNSASINQLLFAQNEQTGEYAYSCTFDLGDGRGPRDYRQDLTRYLKAASASDVADCAPVDQFLHDMLVAFMKNVSGKHSHAKEWLEACFFYSHYGSNDGFVGNPIVGLMEETAIPVTEGTHTADLTRIMQPFASTIYTFTPTESAVYKLESLIPVSTNQDAAQIWLYDDATSTGKPLAYCGDTHVTLDGKNEHNFEVYYYMTAGHKYYLSLAFQMAQTGTYDFKITKIGPSHTEFVPCSEDIYDMVLDDKGEFTGAITLRGAVEYVKDNAGYFHAKNADGSMGDFIYLDVTRVTTGALGGIPLNRLVDKYVVDPKDFTNLDYKMFDFRYCVVYRNDGNVTNYDPHFDLTSFGAKYKDCTQILQAYINAAPKDGEYAGLIKVNQEIVDILSTFIELRLNAVWSTDTATEIESALENEWLRFCWYNKTHDSANP